MSHNPEHLRLLRLRARLRLVRDELTEIITDTHVSDPWWPAVTSMSNEVIRANGIVLSSLKALEGDVESVVK